MLDLSGNFLFRGFDFYMRWETIADNLMLYHRHAKRLIKLCNLSVAEECMRKFTFSSFALNTERDILSHDSGTNGRCVSSYTIFQEFCRILSHLPAVRNLNIDCEFNNSYVLIIPAQLEIASFFNRKYAIFSICSAQQIWFFSSKSSSSCIEWSNFNLFFMQLKLKKWPFWRLFWSEHSNVNSIHNTKKNNSTYIFRLVFSSKRMCEWNHIAFICVLVALFAVSILG